MAEEVYSRDARLFILAPRQRMRTRRQRKRTLRHKCQGNLMNMAESPVNNCLQFLFTLHFKYGARRKAQVLIYSSSLRPGISFGHSQTIKPFGRKTEGRNFLWQSLFSKAFGKAIRKALNKHCLSKNVPSVRSTDLNPRTELYYLSQHRFCAKTFFPACFFLNKLAAAQTACQPMLCKDGRRRLDVTLLKRELPAFETFSISTTRQ